MPHKQENPEFSLITSFFIYERQTSLIEIALFIMRAARLSEENNKTSCDTNWCNKGKDNRSI